MSVVKLTQINADGSVSEVPDFWMDTRSGLIKFGKRIDGRWFERTTKVLAPGKVLPVPLGVVRQAKAIANMKLKREINNRKSKTLIENQIDDYLALSLQECERGEIDEKTYGVRERAMRRARKFWGPRRPEEINRDACLEYIEWHHAEYPGESMFNPIKYFRHLCRFMHERVVGGRPILPAIPTIKDPYAKRERLERKKRKERILTDDEIKAILSVCSPRDRLLVLFMYTMAFRITEACELKWANLRDLDSEDPHYFFGEEDNKAGHVGTQAIHSEIVRAIEDWPRNGEWVFPQQRDPSKPIRPQMIDWPTIKKNSKVTWEWTPHTFRHTCLSRLFSNPANAQAVIMKCFRVSLKVALEHYIHVDPAARATLRDAIKVDL